MSAEVASTCPDPIACMQAVFCYRAGMARQLTIRGVSDEVARKLERLSRERGASVNATVLQILQDAVGLDMRRQRLMRYATWSPQDLAQVQDAIAEQRKIDDAIWR